MSVPLWQRPWFSWFMTGLFGYGAAYHFYTGHPWIGALLLLVAIVNTWNFLIHRSRR